MTDLTPKQKIAHDKALTYAKSGSDDIFMLSGLAGTGKTTTLVEIVKSLEADGFKPAVCTPTGKAAHVINSKQDVFKASTLHKALTIRPLDFTQPIHKRLDELDLKGPLTPEEEAEEKELLEKLDQSKRDGNSLSFEPIPPEMFLADYNILIFDEASMIGAKTYADLIAPIGCKKIFVGDRAQLPPVKEQPAVNLNKAQAHLDEILRQGADSGILKYAHSVHSGRVMSRKACEQYADLTIFDDHNYAFLKKHLKEGQQVVCHTNKERHKFNEHLRPMYGFDAPSFLPLPGEKLMVQENDDQLRLLRGEMLEFVRMVYYAPEMSPYSARAEFLDEQGHVRNIAFSMTDMCPTPLLKNEDKDKKERYLSDRRNLVLRFPYAATAHTAQGSEWDDVLVVGSMMPETWKEWRTWWYTACTRAAKKLTVASYHYALNP